MAHFQRFTGNNLTETIARAETRFAGATQDTINALLELFNVDDNAMSDAYRIKAMAAQIDTAIHAIGILACLPHLLLEGEVVEYLSLGAGNTGREFDLETNLRIAEFKFIQWKGRDSVRQDGLFKDFVNLAEKSTVKQKYLYILGSRPQKFLGSSKRAVESVLKGGLLKRFQKTHPEIKQVREYYVMQEKYVSIVDVSAWIPSLSGSFDF